MRQRGAIFAHQPDALKLSCCYCAPKNREAFMSSTPVTDYPYDLGAYTRQITTKSADAQRWFDRGLNWCFGYHHQEAGQCFAKALEYDPECAMAHWGIAYASGPNYNMPWEFLDMGARAHFLGIAYDAMQAALARKGSVTPP